MFDEAIGCACECLMRRRRRRRRRCDDGDIDVGGVDDYDYDYDEEGAAVTAYLNVSYRRSLPENATSYIRVYVIDGEDDDDGRTSENRGRIMRFCATLGSVADGREEEDVVAAMMYADASCLYVRVRSRL